MLRIVTYRKARTAPLPEHVRADEDCVWDSDEPEYDEDGFDCAPYTPQGSYPATSWDEQVMAWARG